MQVGGNANAVCTPENLLCALKLVRLGSYVLSGSYLGVIFISPAISPLLFFFLDFKNSFDC